MGFFKRKDKVLDLTRHYEKQQEKLEQMKKDAQEQETSSSPLGASFNMFGDASTSDSTSSSNGYADLSTGIDEKKKKLVKRIMDMTYKMEDLSNQIYHLEQRIEVLEKRGNINRV